MLYVCSKVFWFIAQPDHSLIFLCDLAAALSATRQWRIGLALGALDALLLVVIWCLPVGPWLLSPIESRFHLPAQMPSHVDGIIMLGGDESLAFFELAMRYPRAKLVYAGGGPVVADDGPDVAGKVPRWLRVEMSRIIFERKSRDTFEDITIAKTLVHPTENETWILVANAFHVPRSMGIFRKQGWLVVPYPVNYADSSELSSFAYFGLNLRQLSIALKEWCGMAANRALGHSDEWFPREVAYSPVSNTIPLR